MTEYLTAVE